HPQQWHEDWNWIYSTWNLDRRCIQRITRLQPGEPRGQRLRHLLVKQPESSCRDHRKPSRADPHMDINFIKWSNLAMNATSKRIMIFLNGFRNRIPSDRQLGNGEHGFSLIELLIASFVLAIGVLSVAAMIGTSISRNLSSKNDTIAMAAAEQV